MKNADLVQLLKDEKARTVKIGIETSKSLELIKTLQDAIANADDVAPEVEQAANDLATQLGVVDDLVPDAPEPGDSNVPEPGDSNVG